MILGPRATPATLRSSGALDALADTFATEKVVLEKLHAVLCRQRAAVGTDDVQGVGDAVFAIHRLLLLLGETRERRLTMYQLLGHDDKVEMNRLDDLLGEAMTVRLRAEWDALQEAAQELSIEVDLNRRLFRELLSRYDSAVVAPPAPEWDEGIPSR